MCLLLGKNINYMDQCAIRLIEAAVQTEWRWIYQVLPNSYFFHLRYPDSKKHWKTFVAQIQVILILKS